MGLKMNLENSHIHDNTYLCSLDMTHASKIQKIAWLTQIIDNELDRGEEMDEQLISECAEHLEQLSPEVSRSAEELNAQLHLLLAAQSKLTQRPQNYTLPCSHKARPRLRQFMLRIAAIASVFVMIAVLSPQIYAQALVERDNKLSHKAFSHDFINAETTLTDLRSEREPSGAYEATYTDLSAFFRDHGHLDFHYPSNLPEKQSIQSISIIYHSPKSWIIVFSFQDPAIKSFIVQHLSQPAHMIEEPQGEKYLSTGTQNNAISQKEEDGKTVFTAECYTDGLRYTAEAYDFNILKLVLSNTRTQVYSSFSSMDQFLETFDYLQAFLYPKQLPNEIQIISVHLNYRSSANWTVIMRFDQPQNSNRGDMLTISPIADLSTVDFGSDPPILSNETADIYLISHGFSSVYGHYEAVCVVGNMKYTMRIYGYDQFVAFAESIFGPFS